MPFRSNFNFLRNISTLMNLKYLNQKKCKEFVSVELFQFDFKIIHYRKLSSQRTECF